MLTASIKDAAAVLQRNSVHLGRVSQHRFAGSLTMTRRSQMQKIFPGGRPPLLWCPVLAHYNYDGSLDAKRMLAHQTWLVRSGVTGFLVPGSTGDAWDMSHDESLEFLRVCRDVAAKIKGDDRREVDGLGVLTYEEMCKKLNLNAGAHQEAAHLLWKKAGAGGGGGPYLLAGALQADEAGTIKSMEAMKAQAGDDIFGFCICPPRGVADEAQMESALSNMLGKGYPCAVYQLPQVTQVTMSASLLRRLADKYETFLFFKDSSGEDDMALSGISLDGVFMVRGAEGKYAEWLANPINSGYHGFLLSTANVYPAPLTALIDNVAKGADGGDLNEATRLSACISRVTTVAFDLVTGKLADGLGGNAFTNSAKAVDFWMAYGPDAMKQKAPMPLLKSGKRLPEAVVENVGEALKKESLMPTSGYAA